MYTNMIILGISPKKEAERERRVSVNGKQIWCASEVRETEIHSRE